jgi:hypothetical protein
VKLTTDLQPVPRSRKCGSIHPLPHTPSWRSAYVVKHRDNVTFFFYLTDSVVKQPSEQPTPSLLPPNSLSVFLLKHLRSQTGFPTRACENEVRVARVSPQILLHSTLEQWSEYRRSLAQGLVLVRRREVQTCGVTSRRATSGCVARSSSGIVGRVKKLHA